MLKINSLHLGDCLDLMGYIEAGSVDLIITSPPYNLNKEYEKRISIYKYISQQRQVLSECLRVLSKNGSICWQTGNHVSDGVIIPLDSLLYPIFSDLNLVMRNRIVWHFKHGLHCKKRFSGRYETIAWYTRDNKEYIFNLDAVRIPQKYPNKKHFKGDKKGKLSCNPKGMNPSDLWEITNVKNNHPEKTEHPCQYPLDLINPLILALSNPNNLILDPFLGSGTTAVAAKMLGRNYIGIDKEQKYINIAQSRLDGVNEDLFIEVQHEK